MSKTGDDWSFSTFVHNTLAIPKIYSLLGWTVIAVDEKRAEDMDIHHGIDYMFVNEVGLSISVQERFRDSFYEKYDDATLRFRREKNPDAERIRSEFYKINADYLVYGITNGKKFPDKRNTLTDFVKWVVLDLNFLRYQYDCGGVRIITNSQNTRCWISENALCCPEKFNPDGSSSFLPFSIPIINQLWGSSSIKMQKGFL